MYDEHLDRALAEEFAGHGEAIHRLKLRDSSFRSLMELNHAIWSEIQQIQNGLQAASEAYLTGLEKHRLKVLDEIARRLAASMA